ncbi:efflux RND transporter periplasmic adaptor subunit [Brucella intermedia]|uniref:efflux RND transporter periplasmic adaptor subunit n=1 Tax=Brucella TaxID=234 RepID=UPI00147CD46E|nr:HlyD family efflux transporter periplasmic adaptor subunit [Brucella intermedia]
MAAASAIFLLCGYLWYWKANAITPANIEEKTGRLQRLREIIATPQPVSAELHISGTIAAGNVVAVGAPFDGTIREKRVQLGDYVEAGSVLAVMDTADVASRYREAKSVYLKAKLALDGLENWDSGPEMQRARRALGAAQSTLAHLEQQVTELKRLLDQGIIARNEYEGLVQQRDAQRVFVASAQDELEATAQRGNTANRELLLLDLENARWRLFDLERQMAGSNIVAGVSGILTRPPSRAGDGRGDASTEPGASLTRGTALFSIADVTSFKAIGIVDEVDVNEIRIGQSVAIISEAFPESTIYGKVVSVSAEASRERSSPNAAAFEVRVSFTSEDEALRKAIRIGMTVRMTIKSYSSPAAIVVPPSAIFTDERGPYINVRRTGQIIPVPVVLGGTFPAGVEIISGLVPDDRVQIPASHS